MCDALEPEGHEVCELLWQLGGLFEKQAQQGSCDPVIRAHREHVTARLYKVMSRERKQPLVSSVPCIRGSS